MDEPAAISYLGLLPTSPLLRCGRPVSNLDQNGDNESMRPPGLEPGLSRRKCMRRPRGRFFFDRFLLCRVFGATRLSFEGIMLDVYDIEFIRLLTSCDGGNVFFGGQSLSRTGVHCCLFLMLSPLLFNISVFVFAF